MRIIGIFVLIAATIAGIFYLKNANADITTFTITPTVAGVDDIVGAEAKYDVSFVVSDSTSTTASSIFVTFPNDFTLSSVGARDTTTLMQSDLGTGGYVSINGIDQSVSSVNISGNTLEFVLGAPFEYGTTIGADTISFRILRQVFNTTAARIVGAEEFLVDDDSPENIDPVVAIADVEIHPGPAYTLDFSAQPSMSPTPAHGDIASGVLWTTQPIVTAHDRYGNVATSYNTDVVSLVLTDGVSGTVEYGATTPDYCSGTFIPNGFQARADNGVIDFSGALAKYVAIADHDTFTLSAVHTCGSNNGFLTGDGLSGSIIADVVADSLIWSTNPSGCVTDVACTVQGVIEAVKTITVGETEITATDSDYTGDVTVGEDGGGALAGTALQGAMTAGQLTTSGIGYVLAGVAEAIHFTADSGSLSQGISASVSVSTTPVAGTTEQAVTGGGVLNPNPREIPVSDAVIPTHPITSESPVGTVADCNTPYLSTFLRLGDRNEQVSRLQQFLRNEGSYTEGFITGFFGMLTEKAVNAFQQKYAAEILLPQGLSTPTGFARDYTTNTINKLVCNGVIKI